MGDDPFVRPRFPAWATEILTSPERVELLTLDDHVTVVNVEDESDRIPPPAQAWEQFNRIPVRRRVEVTNRNDMRRIGHALMASIGTGDEPTAVCFDPHWGVRIERQSDWLQLAICFNCSNFSLTTSRDNDEVIHSIHNEARRQLRRSYRWYLLRHLLRKLV